ncbi:MAG: hypothetical protein IVW57_18485, partial [Ktedonobacterales bacterium]|nr:hypothetical protein [Ktedonobacterales bacterium]
LGDATNLIWGVVYTALGLLLLVKAIREAWAWRRRRRDGSAPPTSRPIGSSDTWKHLALGAAVVLGGVGLLLQFVPVVKAWTDPLILPLFGLIYVVLVLKDFHGQRP